MLEQKFKHYPGKHESTVQETVDRIILSNPWKVNAEWLGKRYFSSLHFDTWTAPSGDVYICENRPNSELNPTVLLFQNPTHEGFTSVYSPLTPQALKTIIDTAFDAGMKKNFLTNVFMTRTRNELLEHLHLEEYAS